MARVLQVAVAGLGAIGYRVATALDSGIDGLQLAAVSARDAGKADQRLHGFRRRPPLLPLAQLAEVAEVVVECLPPAAFRAAGEPILARGGTLLAASVGALLQNDDLVALATRTGGKILIPSGALAGLDGLSAAAEAGLEAVRLVTRKPPASFGTAVTVAGQVVPTASITVPIRLYRGSARAAIQALPVNVNVAAAVSLAGLGPDRTHVEVWADPTVRCNEHRLYVRSRAGAFTVAVANQPDPGNPKSSIVTAHSLVAALRRMVSPLQVGT